MRVVLDGETVRSAGSTFADALSAGVEAARTRGRIVVEATVDGAAVPEEAFEDPGKGPRGSELVLTSVDPALLVRETFRDAAAALETARQEQKESADLIQAGSVEKALEPLRSAVRTWDVVREVVEKGAATLGREPETMRCGPGEQTIALLIEQLSEGLGQLRQSLGAEDWSALADVLAYDLSDQAAAWSSALRSMADELAPRANTSPTSTAPRS